MDYEILELIGLIILAVIMILFWSGKIGFRNWEEPFKSVFQIMTGCVAALSITHILLILYKHFIP